MNSCIKKSKNNNVHHFSKKGENTMNKRDPKERSNYFFSEEGTNEVSEQIMDAYNSGVIDQVDASIDLDTKTEEGES